MNKKFNVMKNLIVLLTMLIYVNSNSQITNGLIAQYDFNTNALDASVENNHGIVNGATPTLDRFGNANSAYLFDGFNDNIEIETYTNMSPTDGFTISAWIKTTSSSGSPVIYERLETNMGFGLRLNNLGQLRLTINGGEAEAVSQDILTTDKWYHVTGTYDLVSGELKLYIYGNLVASTIYGDPIDYTVEPRNSIGAYGSSNPGAYFNGAIDDIKIYDRSLDNSEVINLFMYSSMAQPNTELNLYEYETDKNQLNNISNLLGQKGNKTSYFLYNGKVYMQL